RNGAQDETDLDLEWSHAIAPAAALKYYFGDSSNSISGSALVDAITSAVNDNKCGVISISFGFCTSNASFYTGTLDPLFSQAASQGQSIFVSSGDQGAAGIVFDPNKGCVNA